MNKQPFYHEAQAIVGDEKAIKKAIKSIKTVLKHSVDVCGEGATRQLLFTATDDVSAEANQKLKALPGVQLPFDIEAEAGDPSDLL